MRSATKANGINMQGKLRLPSGCPLRATRRMLLALQSNVRNVCITHLEIRLIMDADIMSRNNPSKVYSQACFKGLLATSSLVLVKSFYLYVDQRWLEQTHCRYTPKIRAERKQWLSLTPLQSPNLLLLRNELGVGAFGWLCLCPSQVFPVLCG